MLRNVLDIDFAAQKISVKSKKGAIILFDFWAAFPSLSHEFLWDFLLNEILQDCNFWEFVPPSENPTFYNRKGVCNWVCNWYVTGM